MKVVYLLAVLLIGVSLMAQTLPPIDLYGVPHLQEALDNAEARYQAGGPGVTEEELVTFHNHLVDTLGLPDYARTGLPELRSARMSNIRLGTVHGLTPKPGENPKEITHILSPKDAAFLEDHLILNKRFNAGYQIAPSEWTAQKKHEHFMQQSYDEKERTNSGVDHSSEIHQKLREKGSLSYVEAAKLLHYLSETFKLSTIDEAKIAAAALEGK